MSKQKLKKTNFVSKNKKAYILNPSLLSNLSVSFSLLRISGGIASSALRLSRSSSGLLQKYFLGL
jgi:hypothetical protein